jgi:hypothetical protein
MDLTNKKACIISCGVGHGHYHVGIDRLAKSLNFVGWAGETILRKDYPPNSPEHIGDSQYNFKVWAFEEAFSLGYEVVIWCDSSFYAVENPMPLFDYVNDNGIYFFKSGYSLAETATDRLCDYAGVKRSDLVNVSEFATGLIGINILNPYGKEFFENWKQYMLDGMFGGNRVYDPADSQDPIFKFSRQDQSCAAMVLHKMGVTYCGEDKDFQAYKGTNYNPDKILFFIGGI